MLEKKAVDISFAEGLDQKTDPKRIKLGKFARLQNMIFQKGGLFQKRNGYPKLKSLPDTSYTYLTTFNDNLTAIGTNIAAYNNRNSTWVTKGSIQPCSLNVLPVIHNNLQQNTTDLVVASNGLGCCVYAETNGSTTSYKYVIFDSTTGQNISAPALIPVSSGVISGGLRVFYLGTRFILVFTNTIAAVKHLQYVAIQANDPTIIGANTDIAASVISSSNPSWDGFVTNNRLYIAYNTTSGGQSVKLVYLSNSLVLSSSVTYAGFKATIVSVTSDDTTPTNPTIYASFYRSDTSVGYTLAVDAFLNPIMNPVLTIPSGTVANITSSAQDGICSLFYEISNTYSFSSLATNFIKKVNITPLVTTFRSIFSTAAGSIIVSSATGLVNGMYLIDQTTSANIAAGTTFTVSGTTLTLSINTAGNSAGSPGDLLTAATISSSVVVIRSCGLLSKSFIIDGTIYFVAAYESLYQSTDFLINASESTSTTPVITAKLAYQNTGGYSTVGLCGVTVTDQTATTMYFIKDLIQPVNKTTNVATGTQVTGVYTQVGLNMVQFTIGTSNLDTAEIGSDLQITGGFLWMYDGYLPVENNFFLYPDVDTATPANNATWAATGGSMAAKPDTVTNTNAYYYQFTYEWSDNQGNIFRSAPSIPIPVTTTGSGTSGSVTLNIPTLRLTMKTANSVKIVIYRWSVGQQNYYQTTDYTVPLLNDTTIDSVQYVDTHSDAQILGNNLIYTTGGVLENISPPATNIIALFDQRFWLVNAEDPDLLFFSKQVIEKVPVEMSDLLTLFVSPTIATQGTTGPIKSITPMDDKLIIGKRNALFYINGAGPDNTGANNQYSEPIFITSTVGCSNHESAVLIPEGLMFQSDKGIWLLDRALGIRYIGAEVEDYTTNASVTSAVNIPESNRVLFTLDTGITLMYDYFYQQWGTFNVAAISSCIYQNLHTFINIYGNVFQEQPNTYLDGSNPVLMSFKTGPLRLGDLQNYQRAYFFYLLGTFYSPHKLNLNLFFDYEENPSQSVLINPINFSYPYGSANDQNPHGQGNPFGGPTNLENWRIFLQQQRCMSFAIEMQEIYDPIYGVASGAGLTLSGLNVVMGFKKGFRPQDFQTSAG